jgi:hypothetical protein
VKNKSKPPTPSTTPDKKIETRYFVSDLSPEDQAAYNAMMPSQPDKPRKPYKTHAERMAEDWIKEGKDPFDIGEDEIFGPNGEYR